MISIPLRDGEIPDTSLVSAMPAKRLCEILASVEDGSMAPRVYKDDKGTPREFHITDLAEYEPLDTMHFDTLSECVDFFYSNREASNLVRQKSMPLLKSVQASLSKALLKKKKLSLPEVFLMTKGTDGSYSIVERRI